MNNTSCLDKLDFDLDLIINVLRDDFGFKDLDIDCFLCLLEFKIDDNFEEVFND
ncbi:hypothetical protein [Anaerococcus hydrogenalis]|uniref:Uncharacterized protein n=1 Tax=Anaerococcus hydrogenalis ACS-025-V-Sch4 TaxID=879306 RepID=F0H1Q0_9FIRM|nr:hypothetical protein [Anaerococcus hydrogenalis]EGC83560.1 hypothetical protein HMPREF9246_1254 [Anaerococcus hydrogenalis ACS-025-V-Sch4]